MGPRNAGRQLTLAVAIATGLSLVALAPSLVVPALAITCPDNGNLTNASISPGSGTTATNFTFSVTYQDNAGEPPQRVWARFAGGPDIVDLSGSGNLQTGVVYSGSSTLPAGTWTIRLPSPTGRSDPNLSAECHGVGDRSADIDSDAHTNADSDPQADADSDPQTDTQTDAKANGQTDPRPGGDAKAHPKPTPKPAAKPTAKAAGQANGETGLEADGRPERQACVQADRRSDADRVAVGANPAAGIVAGGGPTAPVPVAPRPAMGAESRCCSGCRPRPAPGFLLVIARRRRSRTSDDVPVVGDVAPDHVAPVVPLAPVAAVAEVVETGAPVDDDLAPVDDDAPLKRTRKSYADRSAPVAAVAAGAASTRSFAKPPKKGIERVKVGYRRVRISSEPDEVRSSELGRLERGDEVEILGSHEGFLQVRTPDDITGWIQRHTILGAPST